MGLSSNILWHQTNRKGLDGILKSKKLLFSYSKESPLYGEATKAIPMISLCDLPFSDLGEYLGKYGKFTIGFDRRWGVYKGFNPVWYCENQKLLRNILNKQNHEMQDYLKAYIKPVEGELKTHGYLYRKYRFYDEHEVRLVPSKEEMENRGLKWSLSEEEYEEYKREHQDSSKTDFGIEFSVYDIKYLIVQDVRQYYYFKGLLDGVNVFTQRQVKEDFIGTNHSRWDSKE